MRRSVARGRVFPQYFSTDRRYGRLSLKACALFPLMWVNGDDQGRLPGDPEEIKYATCPNIDHITKADIPELLEELDKNDLIRVYNSAKTKAIQILDWWEVQRLQWAWPSQFPAIDGWEDHLRYKKDAKTVITQNWPASGDDPNTAQVGSGLPSGDSSGEGEAKRFPHLPKKDEKRKGKRRGRGRGKSPEASGDDLSSSSTALQIQREFVTCYEKGWGLTADFRSLAQMRDFSEKLATAGCSVALLHDAFREAAVCNKYELNYVKAVALAWLGASRGPPP